MGMPWAQAHLTAWLPSYCWLMPAFHGSPRELQQWLSCRSYEESRSGTQLRIHDNILPCAPFHGHLPPRCTHLETGAQKRAKMTMGIRQGRSLNGETALLNSARQPGKRSATRHVPTYLKLFHYNPMASTRTAISWALPLAMNADA